MRIDSTKRARRAGKRLDLTAMREALADGRMRNKIGLVVSRDGSHFEIAEDDVLVEVELIPESVSVTCRLGLGGAGAGAGIWMIPALGSEVAVMVPDEGLEAGPIIVGVLSSGQLPDGIAPGVTVIANTSKVLIHDGSGGTEPLVLQSAYAAHTHPTGTGPSGPPSNAASSGTTVLEGK